MGIAAFKSKRVEKALYPILLVMQTMPQYAVLVPALVLFGVGDHAAVIITMVVAIPPMILLTLLGLRAVPPEVIEAGRMSGCNNWQLMTKVLIPTARRDILIGVNQVIMVCFSMAVISAFIGAKGLGFNLLLALNQLNIGLALEAGLCISLIAILLDKMSLAWANKQIDYFGNLTFFQRHKNTFFFTLAIILGILFAYLGSFYFKEGYNYLFEVPHNKGISTLFLSKSEKLNVKIVNKDVVLFKSIDKEKNYSESAIIDRKSGELIHEITRNIKSENSEKDISFYSCSKKEKKV